MFKWRLMPMLAAAACGLGGSAQAATAQNPVVVELFTSQGCSSCPPADALLGQLSERSDVIALAFHVDYWNYLGWADPFSSKAFSNRQRAYVQAMGLHSPYTPQMIVGGGRNVPGYDRQAALDAIAQTGQTVNVALTVDGSMISVTVGSGVGEAEVMAVSFLGRADTKIARGENAGRALTEYGIVRSLKPLGHWSGGAMTLGLDVADIPADADHVAVLVQRAGPGAIVGAAQTSVR